MGVCPAYEYPLLWDTPEGRCLYQGGSVIGGVLSVSPPIAGGSEFLGVAQE